MFPVRIKSENIVGIWAGACSLPVKIEPKAIMLSPDKLAMEKAGGVMWIPLGIVAIGNVLRPFPLDDIEPLLDFKEETVNEEADKLLGEEDV